MEFIKIAPILLCGFIIVGVIAIRSYSILISLNNNVRDTYMILDLYLKRRWDIVTSFIQCIDRFIVEDTDLINELKKLHCGVYEGLSRQRKFKLNGRISDNLKKIIEQCEQIEQLQNDDVFKRHREEIKQVEKRISECKNNYNVAVYKLDEQIDVFPHYIIGGMMKIGDYEVCS